MEQKHIGNAMDREQRDAHESNYTTLFEKVNDIAGSITDAVYAEIVDSAKLEWKEPVETMDDLPSDAEQGETRQSRDTGKVYRFSDGDWKEIQQIDAGPVNEVDKRLTAQVLRKPSENLIERIKEGYISWSTGEYVDNSGSDSHDASSDFIPVQEGQYTFSIDGEKSNEIDCRIFLYDGEKNLVDKYGLKTDEPPFTFSVPANVKYVRVNTQQYYLFGGTIKMKLEDGTQVSYWTPSSLETADILQKQASFGLQTGKFGNLIKKLHSKQDIKIITKGDSLTYGWDNHSADKREPIGEADNGDIISDYRASTTYPESLQEKLQAIYNNNVTVVNKGFPSDTAVLSYEHWDFEPADLTIIMLGTNDSHSFSPQQFANNMRRLIGKELSGGNPVMLLTLPLIEESGTDKAYGYQPYRHVVISLAKEYNIPVMDMVETTENMIYDSHSGNVHFTGKGYDYIGSRIAAALTGSSIINPITASDGIKLLGRRAVDSVVYSSGTIEYLSESSGDQPYPTPEEMDAGRGTKTMLHAGAKITFGFYTETDDLIAVPNIIIVGNNNTLKCTLDFGLGMQQQSNYWSDHLNYGQRANRNTLVDVEIKGTDANWFYSADYGPFGYSEMGFTDINGKALHIAKKGWHTITLENKSNDSYIHFYSLNFISKQNLLNFIKAKRKGRYEFVIGTTASGSTPTTESKMDWVMLRNMLDLRENNNSWWKNPPIKVTVHNWGQNVLTYTVIPGSTTVGDNWSIVDTQEIKIASSPSSYRSLSGVSFDVSGQQFTLKWGGKTDRSSVITIGVS
ncbi:SGNH/GDSL hydrolase family protein [Virgibacillus halophilus]|uniref:SGNH/GDSL hydrolase family protein n=1 Tax=Tigheibacillus halophilus TaxID=361280 RepID=UPI00362DAFC7